MLSKYLKYFVPILYVLVISNCADNDIDQHVQNFKKNTQETASLLKKIMFKETYLSSLKSEEELERFKIVHISDTHLSNWTTDNHYKSPTNLQEAVKFSNIRELRINALVATGDFISNNNETNHKAATQYLNAFTRNFYTNNNIPSFVCLGNHDSNMLTKDQSYYLSKQDLHNTLFSQINYPIHQPTDENYFYADIPHTNGEIFRIISLDVTDQSNFEYNTTHYACFTQKQIDWFTQTALLKGVTQKHHFIILVHHPLQPYSKDRSTYMCAGEHMFGATLIPDIINAFIKRQSFKGYYKSRIKPHKTITVNADYTNALGEFVCYLGGHSHTSAYFSASCRDVSAAKQIMLLANTMAPSLQNNYFSFFKRENDDVTSNSFSIYAIDTEEHKIYITYFGAKSSNSPTIESISYR